MWFSTFQIMKLKRRFRRFNHRHFELGNKRHPKTIGAVIGSYVGCLSGRPSQRGFYQVDFDVIVYYHQKRNFFAQDLPGVFPCRISPSF